MITLAVMGMFLTAELFSNSPLIPVVPKAHASPLDTAPAIVGVFSPVKKDNVFIQNGATSFVMSINITNAGPIFGAQIGINYTAAAVTTAVVDFSKGIFSNLSPTFCSQQQNINKPGFIDQTYLCPQSVIGTGVIENVTFTVPASQFSTIHINTKSVVSNPADVQYKSIDGYFDNRATGSVVYSISNSQPTVTVLRTVLPTTTNTTAPTATVSLATVSGTQGATTVSVVGLPANSVPIIGVPNPCTPGCSVTLQIRVNGGKKGAAGTTPSGTYKLAILGNQTISGSTFLVREAWLTLVVKPPHAPTFVVSSDITNFLQGDGGWTVLHISATLTCTAPTQCANDTLTWSTPQLSPRTGSLAKFTPPSGQFNLGTQAFLANMNITTPPDDTFFGVFKFGINATTSGDYSEVLSRASFVVSINIPQAETMSRAFAYSGVSIATSPIGVNVTFVNPSPTAQNSITVNATARVTLKADSKLRYVNTTNIPSETWAAGKAIIADYNGDFKYQNGELVSGTAPAVGTPTARDSNIRFADLHLNGVWTNVTSKTPKDPVVYKTTADTIFGPGDLLITGTLSTGYLIGTVQTISLAPGQSKFVLFSFDAGPATCLPASPPCLPTDVYTISGYEPAGLNPNQAPAGAQGSIQFRQKFKGDVTGDNHVDISDLSIVGAQFGKTSSSIGFNPAADLNNDGVINISDLSIVGSQFGQSV